MPANKRRLLKLATFLRTLPEAAWNFSSLIEKEDKENKCGTVCCAVGWCPRVFPKDWVWKEYSREIGLLPYSKMGGYGISAATEYFGLKLSDADCLFVYRPYLDSLLNYPHREEANAVTAVDVANAIEEFCRTGKLPLPE